MFIAALLVILATFEEVTPVNYSKEIDKISVSLELISINDPAFTAICSIESDFNPKAFSSGCAGIAQISMSCVKDVNANLDCNKYQSKDRFSIQKSHEIFDQYMQLYGKSEASTLAKAKLWNGGPSGQNSKKAINYARKVEKRYKEINR